VDCGVADFFFAVMSTEQNVEGNVRTVGAVAATPGAAGTAVDASAVGGAGPLPSSGASPRDALHRGDDDLELAMSLQLEETEEAAAAAGESALKRKRIEQPEDLSGADEVVEYAMKVCATQVPGWEKIKICWAPPTAWQASELWVNRDATAADVKYHLETTTGWRGNHTCLVGMRTHTKLDFRQHILLAAQNNQAPLEPRVLMPSHSRLFWCS